MYAILAQTGGLKCAFQVPIIKQLVNERLPDIIVGNSGGALNGILAAQGDLDLLENLWLTVGELAPWQWRGDRWDILERIWLITSGLFLKSKRGLYDLSEIRFCVENQVKLSRLKTEFACGIVSRETCTYHNLLSSNMKTDQELQHAVLASSAIAGLFEPVDIMINGKNHTCSDGGHLHTIPLIPKKYRHKITHLDLIMTYPVLKQDRETSDVNGLWNSVEWAIDIALNMSQIHGLRQIRHMAEQGTHVRIFAPQKHLGGLLDGSDNIINERMKMGWDALANPLVLKSTNILQIENLESKK